MSRTQHIIVWSVAAVFVVILATLLPRVSSLPIEGDAHAYSLGAQYLITEHMYSYTGTEPLYDREPGQSLFMAPIYLFFGVGNQAAVFIVQALLYVGSCFFLLRQMGALLSARARVIAWCFFLLFPACIQIILSLDRELLALSLGMLATGMVFWYRRTQHLATIACAGILAGLLSLTYSAFLFLPFFVLPLFWMWGMRWKPLALFLVCFALAVAPWGIRNTLEKGRPCLAGCYRSAVTLYVRGQQAEYLRGWDPLRCLWAEYISRSWVGLPAQCSFNAVMHTQWPTARPLDEHDLAKGVIGKQEILAHPIAYLWFSVFEVLELHLPYVDGWGHLYNVLATIGSALLYIGVLAGIPTLWRDRRLWIFPVIMLYTTLVFMLTDATPRYLMPVIFCYSVLSAIGYDRLLSRLSSWRR